MVFHFCLPIFLIIVGIVGILLSRKNILLIIISLELLLLCMNYNFVMFSQLIDDIMGQVLSLLVVGIAASESALGIAIIISYHKFYK
jgi:NADH-quinone oxidoreductase subunit K